MTYWLAAVDSWKRQEDGTEVEVSTLLTLTPYEMRVDCHMRSTARWARMWSITPLAVQIREIYRAHYEAIASGHCPQTPPTPSGVVRFLGTPYPVDPYDTGDYDRFAQEEPFLSVEIPT